MLKTTTLSICMVALSGLTHAAFASDNSASEFAAIHQQTPSTQKMVRVSHPKGVTIRVVREPAAKSASQKVAMKSNKNVMFDYGKQTPAKTVGTTKQINAHVPNLFKPK